VYVSHRVLATLAVQNGVFVKRIQKSSKKSLFQKSVVSPQNTALFNPLSTTAFQQNHIMLEETTNSTKNVVVNAYEAARDLRVRQNIERMKSIGIEAAKTKVDAIVANVAKKTKSASSSASHLSKKRVKKRSEISPSKRRTSSRVRGEKAPDIHAIRNDVDSIKNNLWEPVYNEEIYTQEHVAKLGDRHSEWELFVSGYDSQGRRLYDATKGVCCHQCRQKTLGTHTTCNKCKLMRGKFCGDCIYMRYGENVLEINENPEWECPVCRDICNCSFCRTKKGWMPTGNMYRAAIASGYKSVAHYLVLSRQDDEEKAKKCEEEAEIIAERLAKEEAKRLKENPELCAKEQERRKPHWLNATRK
tara:strand:+ start:6419 stop:7498 length:1080 start_codon:yes stop_codon:yes gene_type:complete